jgi:TIR domain
MPPQPLCRADQQKTRVFLSYSRKERAFAETLRDRLISDGFNAYLDVHDIVKGEHCKVATYYHQRGKVYEARGNQEHPLRRL